MSRREIITNVIAAPLMKEEQPKIIEQVPELRSTFKYGESHPFFYSLCKPYSRVYKAA